MIKHFAEVLNAWMVLILLVVDPSIVKELTVHLNLTVTRLQVWIGLSANKFRELFDCDFSFCYFFNSEPN